MMEKGKLTTFTVSVKSMKKEAVKNYVLVCSSANVLWSAALISQFLDIGAR